MAELQQKLAERRRSADAESAVFNGCDYKEAERPQDAGRHSIGGRGVLQFQAFRSGWTSTPKFHDWDKPKEAWEAPKLKVLVDLEAARQNSTRKAAEAQMLLEKAHGEACLAEELLEKAHGKLLQENLLERCLPEAESSADLSQALLARTREMEEAARMDLQRQLVEARRENESLQRRIEEELSRPAASGNPTAFLESPGEAKTCSAAASAKDNIFPELSTTAFGSLLDDCLRILNNAIDGPLPTPAPEITPRASRPGSPMTPEKTLRASRPRSRMIGQRGVTKRHLGR